MVWIFFTAWSMVLGAEIIGDKSLYTIGTLATRFKTLPIFVGSSIAFMIKMFFAVLFVSFISGLPKWFVFSLNSAAFLSIAVVLWNKKKRTDKLSANTNEPWKKIACTSMAGILFTEWGDTGQLTAATLVLKYHLPLVIWFGAVLAMMTKSILVIFFGSSLRKIISQNVLRYIAVGACVILAILSLVDRD